MQPKEYLIPIDIKRGVLNREDIVFKTEDHMGCELKFKIQIDNVTPYNLTNCIVRIVVKSTDIPQQQDCKILSASEGIVTTIPFQSMYTSEGLCQAELQIYDSVDQTKRLTTPGFIIRVNKSLMDDTTVQADPSFSILQNMIISVSNANNIANQAKTTAGKALATANTAVTTINTQTTKVDKAVTDANTALDRAKDVATKSELNAKINILSALPEVKDRQVGSYWMENKDVVRDGLVYENKNEITKSIQIPNPTYQTEFCLFLDFFSTDYTTSSSDKVLYLYGCNSTPRAHITKHRTSITVKQQGSDKYEAALLPELGVWHKLCVSYHQGNITHYFDGEMISHFDDIDYPQNNIIHVGYYSGSGVNLGESIIKNIRLYNRALTQAEINYNFSAQAKNHVSSIEDAQGNNYRFSPTTEDVFHKNLRLDDTLDSIIPHKTVVLTPDEPSATVATTKYPVLNVKCEGQTVKCVSQAKSVYDIKDAVYVPATIVKGREYTIRCNVIKNTKTTNSFYAQTALFGVCDIPVGFTGRIEFVKTALVDSTSVTVGARDVSAETKLEIENYQIIDGAFTQDYVGFLPFGLNSVTPSLSVNNLKYSFYLDYAKGETKKINNTLVNRTMCGQEIGGIDDVADKLYKDGRLVRETREIIFNGSEAWIAISPQIRSPNMLIYAYKLTDSKSHGEVICDGFGANIVLIADYEHYYLEYGNLYIYADKNKYATLNDFKLHLSQINLKCRYQLSMPTTEQVSTTGFIADVIRVGGIGDAKDRLDEDLVTRETKEISSDTLTGEWGLGGASNTDYITYYKSTSDMKKVKSNDAVICDNIPTTERSLWTNPTGEFIGVGTSDSAIYISVAKSEVPTVEHMKTWVVKNPFVCRYPLETPTTEKIDILPTIYTPQDDKTVIKNESNILSKMEVTVAQTANQVTKTLQDQVTALQNAMMLLLQK